MVLLFATLAAGVGFVGAARPDAQPTVDSTNALVAAALARTLIPVRYDGQYRIIDYPMGDVPDNVGVCTDLVIRAYREIGVDLQQLVHEDMSRAFDAYPQIWGLTEPDANIDHRRVPNLETFFERHGQNVARTTEPSDYRPGDIVTWRLNGTIAHIGVVSQQYAAGTKRPTVIHNIGRGPEEEDVLFAHPIVGHYRYQP